MGKRAATGAEGPVPALHVWLFAPEAGRGEVRSAPLRREISGWQGDSLGGDDFLPETGSQAQVACAAGRTEERQAFAGVHWYELLRQSRARRSSAGAYSRELGLQVLYWR